MIETTRRSSARSGVRGQRRAAGEAEAGDRRVVGGTDLADHLEPKRTMAS